MAGLQLLKIQQNLCDSQSSEQYCLSYFRPEHLEEVKVRTLRPLQFQEREDKAEMEEDDAYIFYPVEVSKKDGAMYQAFTMYKRVDKKVRPVSTTFSPNYAIR
jgi:deoxyribodipyrimidine photolyase